MNKINIHLKIRYIYLIVPFLIIILLYLFFLQPLNRLSVARSIPRDPGSKQWKIDDTGDFPLDAPPMATIEYKNTSTPSNELRTFYITKLQERGWTLMNEEKKINQDTIDHEEDNLIFTKSIQGKVFTVNIPIVSNIKKGVADNIIFVSHK